MNRRKFLSLVSLTPLAALFTRRLKLGDKVQFVDLSNQNMAERFHPEDQFADLIKNRKPYSKHETVTLYAGAVVEKLIDENAQKIRVRLASINVQAPELDAIDAAYRHSMRQRRQVDNLGTQKMGYGWKVKA